MKPSNETLKFLCEDLKNIENCLNGELPRSLMKRAIKTIKKLNSEMEVETLQIVFEDLKTIQTTLINSTTRALLKRALKTLKNLKPEMEINDNIEPSEE